MLRRQGPSHLESVPTCPSTSTGAHNTTWAPPFRGCTGCAAMFSSFPARSMASFNRESAVKMVAPWSHEP